MTKFIIRERKYLDLLFDLDDAKLLAQKLVELLERYWIERSIDIYELDEKSTNKCTLRLTLGDDDRIEIKSDSISLTFDEETCDYAVAKLNTFVGSGSMFPAEFQSFEGVGNEGDVMVYFFAADAYVIG